MEIKDIGLFDKVHLSREARPKDGAGVCESADEFIANILPEDIMEKLDQYIGDGNASVTVGGDLTRSEDYGNKAGAFVSVTIRCNNGVEEVRAVHDIIRGWIEPQIAENQARMQGILDDLRGKTALISQVQPTQPSKSLPPKVGRPVFQR